MLLSDANKVRKQESNKFNILEVLVSLLSQLTPYRIISYDYD